MTLLELVYALRQRLDDLGGDTGSPPTGYAHYFEYDDAGCLHPNDALVAYLNEAQEEFCRRVPIVDAETFTLMLRPGIHTYELEPQILAIQQVYHVQNQHVLTKTFHESLYPGVNPAPVSIYLENLQDHRLTVLGTPTVTGTLRLTVQRLPIDPLVWAQRKTAEPEIPAQFHSALISYAAHLCYLRRDADTFSVDLSALALQNFDRLAGPVRSAVDLSWSRGLSNRRPRCQPQFL